MLLQLFGLILLGLANCEKTPEEITPAQQQVYFQYEYTNYAWGFQHTGWLIDSAGNVHSYHLPAHWNQPDSAGYLTQAAMDSNLLATDSISLTLSAEELNQKIALINEASKGEISEPEQSMFDAGKTTYSAFIYNAEKKIYKSILLKQTGDFSIQNTSMEATQLHQWMEHIHLRILNAK